MNQQTIENTTATLIALANLGQLTMELLHAQRDVKDARGKFAVACQKWKRKNGLAETFVSKQGPDWDRMTSGCLPTYNAIFAAKRKVYNIQRRMVTAAGCVRRTAA